MIGVRVCVCLNNILLSIFAFVIVAENILERNTTTYIYCWQFNTDLFVLFDNYVKPHRYKPICLAIFNRIVAFPNDRTVSKFVFVSAISSDTECNLYK